MYRIHSKSTSRPQLVHISKRTYEPIVSCYCARLRRSYIINLMNSCNQFKLPSLPVHIRTLSSSPSLPLGLRFPYVISGVSRG